MARLSKNFSRNRDPKSPANGMCHKDSGSPATDSKQRRVIGAENTRSNIATDGERTMGNVRMSQQTLHRHRENDKNIRGANPKDL
ncbi:hypothetical protein KIN20_004920 [Parelaphostrongylus tenuis]|uniref:Uncharacterized protein n=1 Tax=Parelaphostrongylus tenuis TaxID=148309 RepID=A0AAD5LZH5_PARTN|nr:hypothetical protein KIN20_004920 [Parelaphostrongylus tenuis]